MTKRESSRVELLNIPDYRQGSHDGLCTYYCCAMLLATLYPEYQPSFGLGDRRRRAGLVVEDPLVKHFRDSVNTTADKAIASWFYTGAHMETICQLLNRIMRAEERKTRFRHARKNRTIQTFHEIAASIDQGLPVIIGWDTEDFGTHAVVVRGYDIRKFHWFLLRDPGGEERISWESLKEAMQNRLDVIYVRPDRHNGLRPDKLTGEGAEQRLERWWYEDGTPGYFDVQKLFAAARGLNAEELDDAES